MKKNKKILSIIIIVISSLIFLYFLISSISFFTCFKTALNLPVLANHEYLKIKIFGTSYSDEGNTISGEFVLLNSDGNEIAKIERSWSGSSLSVEFVSVNIKDRTYTFPKKIYGKNSTVEKRHDSKKGTCLEKYYNYNNQCMLLGREYSLEDRKNLYRLSSYATGNTSFFNFGHINNFSVDLSKCKPYRYYSVFVDSNGKVNVLEI